MLCPIDGPFDSKTLIKTFDSFFIDSRKLSFAWKSLPLIHCRLISNLKCIIVGILTLIHVHQPFACYTYDVHCPWHMNKFWMFFRFEMASSVKFHFRRQQIKKTKRFNGPCIFKDITLLFCVWCWIFLFRCYPLPLAIALNPTHLDREEKYTDNVRPGSSHMPRLQSSQIRH